MAEAPFTRATAWSLAAVAGLSLVAGFAGFVFGERLSPVRSAGADTFSYSALGHRAFLELLRGTDLPVLVGRTPDGWRGGDVLVVAAEPRLDGDSGREVMLESLASDASRLLIVAPKWEGEEDPERPGWVKRAHLIDADRTRAVLKAAGIEGRIERPAGPVSFAADGFADFPDLERPQLLVESESLVPWIAAEEGVLLGELESSAPGRQRWILADPDLLSNHGIARGRNAHLVLEAVRRMADGASAVVLDETLHGHLSRRGVWERLFRFPLLLFTLQAAFACALLVWSATQRFGSPRPEPRAIEAGKAALIENTTQLLAVGGHVRHMLGRYLELQRRRVAEALHVADPEGSGSRELARLAREREVSEDLEALNAAAGAIESRGALETALRIHRWREEMLHGPGTSPRDR